MTENLNVDNQNQDGANGSPNQSVSPENGGSIKDANELSKLLKAEIAEALKPVLSEVRGVQGRQDKDRTAMREFMDEFNKGKAKGLSDDAAEAAATRSISERKEAESDKLLIRQIAEKLGLSSAGNGATPDAGVVDTVKVFSERGLDLKDPQVAMEASKKYASPADAELAAYKLRDRLAATPTHNPAQDASIVGKQLSPQNVDALTKQYQSDMIANRGKPDALRKVKEQAIKNGVPVDSVSFT